MIFSPHAERTAHLHGLFPREETIGSIGGADPLLPKRGRFTLDERDVNKREDARWSPHHGRPLRVRVAATHRRSVLVRDGADVFGEPGTGHFLPYQHRLPVAEPA